LEANLLEDMVLKAEVTEEEKEEEEEEEEEQLSLCLKIILLAIYYNIVNNILI